MLPYLHYENSLSENLTYCRKKTWKTRSFVCKHRQNEFSKQQIFDIISNEVANEAVGNDRQRRKNNS